MKIDKGNCPVLHFIVFEILLTIIEKGHFTRYAWGIATDTRLNHLPVSPDGYDENEWYGRNNDSNGFKFNVDTGRQNFIGFPAVNAFLFTIRTYFYDIDILDDFEKNALISAINSMTQEILAYKGLTDTKKILLKRLYGNGIEYSNTIINAHLYKTN